MALRRAKADQLGTQATLRSRLNFASVVSLVVLFVALGGSSYAALAITGKDVENGSLTGKDLKTNSVKAGT